jgi:ankyrin repeat protein
LAGDRNLYSAALNILQMLLSAGADPAVRRNDGRTAAMLAQDANLHEIAKLLEPGLADR